MLAISLLLYCSTESDEEDAFISRESRFNGATAWVKVSVKWHLSPDSSEEEWSEPRQCHFLKKIIEVSFNEFGKSVPSSLLKVPENKKRDSLGVKAEAAEIFNHVLPLLVHSVWNQHNEHNNDNNVFLCKGKYATFFANFKECDDWKNFFWSIIIVSFVQHSRLGEDEDWRASAKDKTNQRQINARRQNKRTFGTVQSLVCRKEIGNKWAEPLLLATRSLRL